MSAFRRLAVVAGLCTVGLICGPELQPASLAQTKEQTPPTATDRLKDLGGQFEVDKSDPGGQAIVPAELLGLAKGAVITIEGNELRSDEKLLATLTTDFSATGLDLDKAVHVSRRPVLLTLPSGKGLLCAYELQPEHGFVLVHPHTMGRVSAGTWLYLKRSKK